MQSFLLPEIACETELCDFARIVSIEILFYTTACNLKIFWSMQIKLFYNKRSSLET